jgi:hypothetical protein
MTRALFAAAVIGVAALAAGPAAAQQDSDLPPDSDTQGYSVDIVVGVPKTEEAIKLRGLPILVRCVAANDPEPDCKVVVKATMPEAAQRLLRLKSATIAAGTARLDPKAGHRGSYVRAYVAPLVIPMEKLRYIGELNKVRFAITVTPPDGRSRKRVLNSMLQTRQGRLCATKLSYLLLRPSAPRSMRRADVPCFDHA